MKKPDKERSDNEVPTTDIRKPFFFIGRYYLFTISFFFIILVVMVVREGKVPQYQGFRDFCPYNQTDNRLDNRSDNWLLFLLQPFFRKP